MLNVGGVDAVLKLGRGPQDGRNAWRAIVLWLDLQVRTTGWRLGDCWMAKRWKYLEGLQVGKGNQSLGANEWLIGILVRFIGFSIEDVEVRCEDDDVPLVRTGEKGWGYAVHLYLRRLHTVPKRRVDKHGKESHHIRKFLLIEDLSVFYDPDGVARAHRSIRSMNKSMSANLEDHGRNRLPSFRSAGVRLPSQSFELRRIGRKPRRFGPAGSDYKTTWNPFRPSFWARGQRSPDWSGRESEPDDPMDPSLSKIVFSRLLLPKTSHPILHEPLAKVTCYVKSSRQLLQLVVRAEFSKDLKMVIDDLQFQSGLYAILRIPMYIRTMKAAGAARFLDENRDWGVFRKRHSWILKEPFESSDDHKTLSNRWQFLRAAVLDIATYRSNIFSEHNLCVRRLRRLEYVDLYLDVRWRRLRGASLRRLLDLESRLTLEEVISFRDYADFQRLISMQQPFLLATSKFVPTIANPVKTKLLRRLFGKVSQGNVPAPEKPQSRPQHTRSRSIAATLLGAANLVPAYTDVQRIKQVVTNALMLPPLKWLSLHPESVEAEAYNNFSPSTSSPNVLLQFIIPRLSADLLESEARNRGSRIQLIVSQAMIDVFLGLFTCSTEVKLGINQIDAVNRSGRPVVCRGRTSRKERGRSRNLDNMLELHFRDHGHCSFALPLVDMTLADVDAYATAGDLAFIIDCFMYSLPCLQRFLFERIDMSLATALEKLEKDTSFQYNKFWIFLLPHLSLKFRNTRACIGSNPLSVRYILHESGRRIPVPVASAAVVADVEYMNITSYTAEELRKYSKPPDPRTESDEDVVYSGSVAPFTPSVGEDLEEGTLVEMTGIKVMAYSAETRSGYEMVPGAQLRVLVGFRGIWHSLRQWSGTLIRMNLPLLQVRGDSLRSLIRLGADFTPVFILISELAIPRWDEEEKGVSKLQAVIEVERVTITGGTLVPVATDEQKRFLLRNWIYYELVVEVSPSTVRWLSLSSGKSASSERALLRRAKKLNFDVSFGTTAVEQYYYSSTSCRMTLQARNICGYFVRDSRRHRLLGPFLAQCSMENSAVNCYERDACLARSESYLESVMLVDLGKLDIYTCRRDISDLIVLIDFIRSSVQSLGENSADLDSGAAHSDDDFDTVMESHSASCKGVSDGQMHSDPPLRKVGDQNVRRHQIERISTSLSPGVHVCFREMHSDRCVLIEDFPEGPRLRLSEKPFSDNECRKSFALSCGGSQRVGSDEWFTLVVDDRASYTPGHRQQVAAEESEFHGSSSGTTSPQNLYVSENPNSVSSASSTVVLLLEQEVVTQVRTSPIPQAQGGSTRDRDRRLNSSSSTPKSKKRLPGIASLGRGIRKGREFSDALASREDQEKDIDENQWPRSRLFWRVVGSSRQRIALQCAFSGQFLAFDDSGECITHIHPMWFKMKTEESASDLTDITAEGDIGDSKVNGLVASSNERNVDHFEAGPIKSSRHLTRLLKFSNYRWVRRVHMFGEAVRVKYGAESLREDAPEDMPLVLVGLKRPQGLFVVSQNVATLAEKQRLSASGSISLTCQDVLKSNLFSVIDNWNVRMSYRYAPSDKVQFVFAEGDALTISVNDRVLEHALSYYSELVNDPWGDRGVFLYYFVNRTEEKISFVVHGEKGDDTAETYVKAHARAPFDLPLSLSEKVLSAPEVVEDSELESYPVRLMSITVNGFETVPGVDFGTPGRYSIHLAAEGSTNPVSDEARVVLEVLADTSGTVYVVVWSPVQVFNHSLYKAFDVVEMNFETDQLAKADRSQSIAPGEEQMRATRYGFKAKVMPGSFSCHGLRNTTNVVLTIRPSDVRSRFSRPIGITNLKAGSVTLIECPEEPTITNKPQMDGLCEVSGTIPSSTFGGNSPKGPQGLLTKGRHVRRLFMGSSARMCPVQVAVSVPHADSTSEKVTIMNIAPPLVIRNALAVDMEFVIQKGTRSKLSRKLLRLSVPGVNSLVKRLGKRADTSHLCYADLAPGALQELYHISPVAPYSVSVRDLRGIWSDPVECFWSHTTETTTLPAGGNSGTNLWKDVVRKVRHGYIYITCEMSLRGSLVVSTRAKYRIRNMVRGCSLRISEIVLRDLHVSTYSPFVIRHVPRASGFDVTFGGFLFWSYDVLFLATQNGSWSRVRLPVESSPEKWVKFNVTDGKSGQIYRLVAQVVDGSSSTVTSSLKINSLDGMKEVKLLPRLEIINLLQGADIEIREKSVSFVSVHESSRVIVPSNTSVPLHLHGMGRKRLVQWLSPSLFLLSGLIDLSHIGSFSLSVGTERPNRYIQALMKTNILTPYRRIAIVGIEIFKDRGRKVMRILPRPKYGPEFRIVNHTDVPIVAMQSSRLDIGPTCLADAHGDQFFAWSDLRTHDRKITFATLHDWNRKGRSDHLHLYKVPLRKLTSSLQTFCPGAGDVIHRGTSSGEHFPLQVRLVGGDGPTRAIHIHCQEMQEKVERPFPLGREVVERKSLSHCAGQGFHKDDLLVLISSLSVPRLLLELSAANGEKVTSIDMENALLQFSKSLYREVIDIMAFRIQIRNDSDKSHLPHVLLEDRGASRSYHPAEPLVSMQVSTRVQNTKLNPSELVYIENFRAAIAPLKVGLESRFVDQLAKAITRYIGKASKMPDENVLWGASNPLEKDLMHIRSSTDDSAIHQVNDSGIKPVYIRHLNFEGAEVLLNFRQNGRFAGNMNEQTLDATLRYVLRLTPSIYSARLRLRGLTLSDCSFQAAEIPAELTAHFAKEGLAQIRSVIPSLAVFARLENLVLGKSDDEYRGRWARLKRRAQRLRKTIQGGEVLDAEPFPSKTEAEHAA